MKITIVAVGKAKRGPEQALFDTYRKRLTWQLKLVEVEEKRPLSAAERMAREADLIRREVPDDIPMVALDERGENLSSRKIAEHLGKWQDTGRGNIALVIGGADGLDQSLRERADLLIAFGKATWPHMMVRAMLAEQIYRAQQILAGHPYHRD